MLLNPNAFQHTCRLHLKSIAATIAQGNKKSRRVAGFTLFSGLFFAVRWVHNDAQRT
jgi:hypothetical protein